MKNKNKIQKAMKNDIKDPWYVPKFFEIMHSNMIKEQSLDVRSFCDKFYMYVLYYPFLTNIAIPTAI